MDTKSHTSRVRIQQILSTLSVDSAMAESDLLHEFDISIAEAIRISDRHIVRRRKATDAIQRRAIRPRRATGRWNRLIDCPSAPEHSPGG